MRVATLFKRLLRLDRERVVGLELTESDGREAVIVDLGLPARRALLCSGCARRVRVAYDRRIQTWRHLDLARTRLVLRCEIRRIGVPTVRDPIRAGAVGSGGIPVHQSVRGHLRLPGQSRAQERRRRADAESTGRASVA
jgi:hypothetical protein